MQDRSLYYDDIKGARSKNLYPSVNKNFPYEQAYQQNLQNVQLGRHMYQDAMLSLPERIAPQGIQYFGKGGKKHYERQRGEIDQFKALQNLYDPPKKYGNDYDRSLQTKDIDGAVTNTLISKVVKNKEIAQTYNRSESQPRSLHQPASDYLEDYNPKSRSRIDNENQEFQKNKSAIVIFYNKQHFDTKPQLSEYEQQQYISQLRQEQEQQQQQADVEEDKRRRLQQLQEDEMFKQWKEQRQLQLQLEEQRQVQKQNEQAQQQALNQAMNKDYNQYLQNEENKKQIYANELKKQQQDLQQYQSKQAPNLNISKSQVIGRVLGAQTDKDQTDSISKELQNLEEQRRKQLAGIHQYKNHELQQYLYDMKNGKVAPTQVRNTPTFMSYAGNVISGQYK